MEHKLIKPRGSHGEFNHQILAQSDKEGLSAQRKNLKCVADDGMNGRKDDRSKARTVKDIPIPPRTPKGGVHWWYACL